MTRTELINALAHRFSSLTDLDVEIAVKEMLDAIGSSLVSGRRVEIRGFGIFALKYRPPRKARNPKTGEPVFVRGKRVIHFKAGKEMRERVDQSVRLEITRLAA